MHRISRRRFVRRRPSDGPLARLGRWPRLCAAGSCLVLAAGSAADTARAHPGSAANGIPVVVVTRALPAGHVLGRRDVELSRWPPGLRIASAIRDPARVIGARLAGPMAAREPVFSGRLVGSGLADGLGRDAVAVAVTVDAEMGPLARPGERIDLLATAAPDPSGVAVSAARARTEQVAEGARVLAVYPSAGGAAVGATALILAVPREIAVRIAALRSAAVFTVLGDSP